MGTVLNPIMDSKDKEIALLKQKVREYLLKFSSEDEVNDSMKLYDSCFERFYERKFSVESIATLIYMEL